ncbi:NEP1-interacting protein 1, partial [Mucuna pruriens]
MLGFQHLTKRHILTLSLIMTKWFSEMLAATRRCKEVFSLWVLAASGGYAFDLLIKVVQREPSKGRPQKLVFLMGLAKELSRAIAALELLNFAANDEALSKVALLRSLLNGNLFMEWICPAVAQAYQCHMNARGTTYREESDIDSDIVRGRITVKGMAWNIIQKLPVQQFNSSKMLKLYNDSCCSICFQNFEDEEFVRALPKCDHFFHLVCIDKWLVQQGSCPMCRIYVPHL